MISRKIARMVRDLEHQRGLVGAGAGGLLMADDGEARFVVRIVLDVVEENPQSVFHRRLPTGDCRRPRFLLRQLRGDGGA